MNIPPLRMLHYKIARRIATPLQWAFVNNHNAFIGIFKADFSVWGGGGKEWDKLLDNYRVIFQ